MRSEYARLCAGSTGGGAYHNATPKKRSHYINNQAVTRFPPENISACKYKVIPKNTLANHRILNRRNVQSGPFCAYFFCIYSQIDKM